MTYDLKAPFPWFGGKSPVASLVWDRLGDCQNYVEPFFGSGAVLLARPHPPQTETINDLDALVSNFWRATRDAPDEVARWASCPVNEADLHARHIWIVTRLQRHQSRMMADPDYYDARMAGYWVYGMCCWIGSGFASGKGPWVAVPDDEGVLALTKQIGSVEAGINRQMPHIGNSGMGINRKIPYLGGPGLGINKKQDADRDGDILDVFKELAERLRDVRVCCGDWSRVLGRSQTESMGLTAVFLDPPYGVDDREMVYRQESTTVASDVTEWCVANGGKTNLRIALCGYEGEGHHTLEDHGWVKVAWKAQGGYGTQGTGAGRTNAGRERIWFSPHCQNHTSGYQPALFEVTA